MDWFLDVVKSKYAKFEGRALREAFWIYSLIFFVLLAFGYKLHATITAGIFLTSLCAYLFLL